VNSSSICLEVTTHFKTLTTSILTLSLALVSDGMSGMQKKACPRTCVTHKGATKALRS
jgi:hypothetical protein